MDNFPTYSCLRCRGGHTWYPRTSNVPLTCPKCKSPYWDRRRKNHDDGRSASSKAAADSASTQGNNPGARDISGRVDRGVRGNKAVTMKGKKKNAGNRD